MAPTITMLVENRYRRVSLRIPQIEETSAATAFGRLGQNPGHLSQSRGRRCQDRRGLGTRQRVFADPACRSSESHDEGKRNCKWQRAMGNLDCAHPVAKPLTERPASMGGFRHEWESLLTMRARLPAVPDSLGDSQQWLDLWRHLVASHHGHLRPWISNHGFSCEVGKQQQSVVRLESAERFSVCSVSSARGDWLTWRP